MSLLATTATDAHGGGSTSSSAPERQLHERRRRHQALLAQIGDEAQGVAELRHSVDARTADVEACLAEWSHVQRACSDFVLGALRQTAGGGSSGAHQLRAVADVLRRDEARLGEDLRRLSQVHDDEDANFRAQRRELEAAKTEADAAAATQVENATLSRLKSLDHRTRCAALRAEVEQANEAYCDDILEHARAVFLARPTYP